MEFEDNNQNQCTNKNIDKNNFDFINKNTKNNKLPSFNGSRTTDFFKT